MSKLTMPKLGLTMTEGVLLEWKVASGESYKAGQVIFVVETDKAANDIEAVTDGVLIEQIVPAGDTVPVGSVVALIQQADNEGDAEWPPLSAGVEGINKPANEDNFPLQPSTRLTKNLETSRIIATPLARRLAESHGVSLSSITGSGPRGRIKSADIERARRQNDKLISPSQKSTDGKPRRLKPSPVQKAIARRLSLVKHGTPHYYLSTEVEVSRLLALRADLNASIDHNRLTLTHFFVAAVAKALSKFPNINRIWVDDEIIQYDTVDIGVAVDGEMGLFVPIIRNVNGMSLDAISLAMNEVVEKARAGKLAVADMEGGAITISNAGMHDVTWLTSIINYGQSCIMGVGSVRETFRPDANGQPLLRREMGIVFSGDHRIHSGVEGLRFMTEVKLLLEQPLNLVRR